MNLKNKYIMEGKKHLVKGLDVDFVVDHLLSLEDPYDFELINKLRDLWEVYNKSWNKFNNFLSDFWKVMKNIEKLDSFDKTCKEIIDAWYDDIEKIFYSDNNPENFKLNYGFKGNDVFESKKSIKEEIDRPTWSKWVVNNIHHIEYFFNGKVVDKRMLNSLFESEGFDTNVDAVEDEIKKAVRSVKLGNLDGNALHIAHNSVGNRIDLVFDIGKLLGSVESLFNDECVIRINGDVYEQDEMWNFGFAIYLTCDTYPMDFSLAESKRKPSRKSIKESKVDFQSVIDKVIPKEYAKNKNAYKYALSCVESLYNEDEYDSDSAKVYFLNCYISDSFPSWADELDEEEMDALANALYDGIMKWSDIDSSWLESKKSVKKSLKESVDGYIATDEDCNMNGKCWVLDGSYNFIMEFLQEWGIAPKDVKVKNGMTTLYNADGNPFGYVNQDEEVDIFVADKTTNWTWENHNPSTKRVKVTALDKIF